MGDLASKGAARLLQSALFSGERRSMAGRHRRAQPSFSFGMDRAAEGGHLDSLVFAALLALSAMLPWTTDRSRVSAISGAIL